MNVSNIAVRDIEGRWESLTLALQAISRWAGVELHFRSLNAALGLSFMTSAPRDNGVSLAWWMALGRDAFLIETGKLFGLVIEPLYSADPTVQSGDAFGHFQTTLKPKVQEALANNQPVLAWRGWPDYHSYLWGILTTESDSELGFAGTTMWSGGKPLSLSAPPARLYVVTEATPRQPEADELLYFAVRNTQHVVHNQVDSKFGVVTGLQAYDRWLQWLSEDPDRHSNGDRSPNCHYQMARFISHSRESACRFIDHYKDGLHQDVHPYLEAMLADCCGVINALATSRDLKAVEVLYMSEDGRDALAAGVRAARDFLKAQIKSIDHLSAQLKR